MYKTYDFRKNIRQAFNEAAEGREVLIERYGDVFQLVAKVGKPKNGVYLRGDHDYFEDSGKPIEPNREHTLKFKLPKPDVIKEVFGDTKEYKFCKHGADPKMCKFAKPRRPCK